MILDGLACPRKTQALVAGSEPTSACIWIDSGVGDFVAKCDSHGLTLCREDGECTAPAVCVMVRVGGKNIDGVVGACVAP